PISLRCKGEYRLIEQRIELKLRCAFDCGANAEIDLSAPDALQQVVRGQLPEIDVDAGIRCLKGRQRLRQDGCRNGRHATERQCPALNVDDIPDLAQSVFPFVERAPGMSEKLFAFGS